MRACVPSTGLSQSLGSGGANYSRVVLARLLEDGEDIHVLLAKHQPTDLPVERIPWGRGLRWPVANLVFGPLVWRCARRHKRTLLVSHSIRYTGLPCLLAGRRLGLPVVVHAHHWEPTAASQFLERYVAQRADSVIADSQFVKRQLVQEGVRPERVRVVYCGVDPPAPVTGQDVESARRSVGVPPTASVVLSVGPVIARKKPLELLRLFRAATRDLPNAHLVWLGEGPYRITALGLASDFGISQKVHFPGFVPESVKAGLLYSASVFAMTSRLEGFPLAALEAMAHGLPVIAYRAGPMAELLGQAGVLATTPTNFAWRLKELLASARWREIVARDCRERALAFSWRQTVEGVRAAYQATGTT